MEKNIWHEEYSVGNTLLDNQHKQLIDIINNLLTEVHKNPGSEAAYELLDRMVEYSSMHFDTEELILEACGYPELSKQKAEHNEYRTNITKFFIGAVNEDGSISSDIQQFLIDWWSEHILNSDMLYKPFLQGRPESG